MLGSSTIVIMGIWLCSSIIAVVGILRGIWMLGSCTIVVVGILKGIWLLSSSTIVIMGIWLCSSTIGILRGNMDVM